VLPSAASRAVRFPASSPTYTYPSATAGDPRTPPSTVTFHRTLPSSVSSATTRSVPRTPTYSVSFVTAGPEKRICPPTSVDHSSVPDSASTAYTDPSALPT